MELFNFKWNVVERIELNIKYIMYLIVTILLGFRYSASSIPLISSAGVAIGAGSIPSILIFAICRNPVISNVLIRWALIGSSLVEVSGSIGSVYSLLIPYAFSSTINKKRYN